jgi:hypothetical protein
MSFRESLVARDNGAVASDPEAVKAAAFRLKHDFGKAIRWNAPAVRESDPEALRRRLGRDLLETRVGPDGRARTAAEVYEAWLAREGALFSTERGPSARLLRMSEAIETIRRRLPRLDALEWEELVALDEGSLFLQQETRALWLEAVAADPDLESSAP